MIAFPLWTIVIPYLLVAAFVAVLALFTMYHFVKYSETTKVSFVAVFLYLAGTAYILFFTWSALRDADWQQTINFATVFAQSDVPFDL